MASMDAGPRSIVQSERLQAPDGPEVGGNVDLIGVERRTRVRGSDVKDGGVKTARPTTDGPDACNELQLATTRMV